MKLYHVTRWNQDKQERLIPRIPEKTCAYEDTKTERISLAPSIEECICGLGDVNICNVCNGRIKVYSVSVDIKDPALIDWKTLYEANYVIDAPLFHEYWYRKTIEPETYSEYQIKSIRCGTYLMVKSSQKQEVIEAIEECGECLSKELKKKTAIEIINVYRNSRKLPCIKRLLRKRKEIYDRPQKEIYKKLFGNIPKQYSVLDAFFEQKYIEIEHCNIIKIN